MTTTEESPNTRGSRLFGCLMSPEATPPEEVPQPPIAQARDVGDATAASPLAEAGLASGPGPASGAAVPLNGHGADAIVDAGGPAQQPLQNGAASDGSSKGQPDVGRSRMWLPSTAEPFARRQLSEFVELSRRLRVPSLADQLNIGPGEWLSTAMVRATAFVISTYMYPGVASWHEMTDLLMRSLAGPTNRQDDVQSELGLATTTGHGRVLLDVSTSNFHALHFRLIRVKDRLRGVESNYSEGDAFQDDPLDAAGGGRELGAQSQEAADHPSTNTATSERLNYTDELTEVTGTGAMI
jgi:hypothetical protein